MKQKLLQAMIVLLDCLGAHAQVNSGSNGSDGAFNPTTNIVINMADHPTGIYQYTSVNISNGVTVTFIPNANNTPVVWLVQTKCVIEGGVDVSATNLPYGGNSNMGLFGGPGGYRGGNGGTIATGGQGPGGGNPGDIGGNASFGTAGDQYAPSNAYTQGVAGLSYGNQFLLPLRGGSGGGGSARIWNGGGGGGAGAILIAASEEIQLTGSIMARGGDGSTGYVDYNGSPGGIAGAGGGGSGGSVRLVTAHLTGNGNIDVQAGHPRYGNSSGVYNLNNAGQGRARLDVIDNNFGGTINGPMTIGFQPIILPTAGQGAQLAITSVGGVPVPASPTGGIATPDAVLSAQQNNPIPIVVHCSNIPLNTQITVSVKPANGAAVSATGLNTSGTLSSSTATVLINMPRGGGIIYATAATGN